LRCLSLINAGVIEDNSQLSLAYPHTSFHGSVFAAIVVLIEHFIRVQQANTKHTSYISRHAESV
jgi:hypothetical protein